MEPPEFVRRLASDPHVARNAAFAIFVLTYLESAGLLPAAAEGGPLPERVTRVRSENEHLLAYFTDRAAHVRDVNAAAARDLAAWARAQHLEREEPQVAYELGLLALSVTLPPVLVGSLRELPLMPETTVAELPDGAGYPTIFLATLHPSWLASQRATLFVASIDARQLAAWAMLLLTRDLRQSDRIRVVGETPLPTAPPFFDYVLSYHTPPDLDPARLVRAGRLIVV